MPAEPPPELSEHRAAASGGAEPAAPGERPLPVALTWGQRLRQMKDVERGINSPTPLTLRLLGVVFVATLFPWIGAKAACNLRDAPIRQPHDPPTETLAKSAKSAALELAQRAASGRFREAAELAKGDVAKELLEADARCAQEPAPCDQRRAQTEHVFTRAVVASRGPLEASVRTESRVGGAPPERFAMHLAQENGRWYVVRRTPLQGALDAPVSPGEVVSPIAIREVPGHGNMSVAPPASPHGAAPHGASPHGSAPSNGAPSGTGDP